MAPLGASAFDDGAPWESAAGEGCASCHFDAPMIEGAQGLSIEGLPPVPVPGDSVEITVRLADPHMSNAGFLLAARSGGPSAGVLYAPDSRVESNGSLARSTADGAAPLDAGATEWRIRWQLPESFGNELVLDVQANAGNGDRSPFGDRLHRHTWRWTAPEGVQAVGESVVETSPRSATRPQGERPDAGSGSETFSDPSTE